VAILHAAEDPHDSPRLLWAFIESQNDHRAMEAPMSVSLLLSVKETGNLIDVTLVGNCL
jgi:hypothetical protein